MLFDLYLTHKGGRQTKRTKRSRSHRGSAPTLIYFLNFLIVFKIFNFSVNITVKNIRWMCDIIYPPVFIQGNNNKLKIKFKKMFKIIKGLLFAFKNNKPFNIFIILILNFCKILLTPKFFRHPKQTQDSSIQIHVILLLICII